MKIAVEGCCHGELDRIYEAIWELERREQTKIDLLICCGDFQAVRNDGDLSCMAVPPKYRQMNTFYKYYSGEKKAPVLTLFIGGNHEASNYLWELGYGGWVAPNIYYLGYSGVVQCGGVRIAGLSGIYKHHDYHKGHYERPPYDNSTCRSTYHVRNYDVFKLKKISGHVDIGVSHDWPRGIYHYGNTEQLLRHKPYFRGEVESNTLGSPPAEDLLTSLRPDHWFSAHLHCHFEATYKHLSPSGQVEKETKFLALDKCMPRKRFLQVVNFPRPNDDSNDPPKLSYDPEWLMVTKATAGLFPTTQQNWMWPLVCEIPANGGSPEEEMERLTTAFGGSLQILDNFRPTAPCHDPSKPINRRAVASVTCANPQTTEFCEKLGIPNPFAPVTAARMDVSEKLTWLGEDEGQSSMHTVTVNPDRIDIDEDSEGDNDEVTPTPLSSTSVPSQGDDDGFLPLTSTEPQSIATGGTSQASVATEDKPLMMDDSSDARKRVQPDGSSKPVMKRRNASLYQTEDTDNNRTEESDPNVYLGH